MSLVVVDADVLGRARTGDETYVANLLRHLPLRRADGSASRRSRAGPTSCRTASSRSSCPRGSRSCGWRGACRGSSAPAAGARALPARAAARLPVPGGGDGARPLFRARSERDGAADRLVVQDGRAALGAARGACARRLRADEGATSSSSTASRRRGSRSRRTASTPPSRRATVRRRVPALRRRDRRSARTRWPPPPRRAAVGLPLVVAGPEKRAGARARARAARRRPARLRRAGTSSPSSTAAPRASCSRRATRASGCPCSRRWPAARPSSPRRIRRCARSPATRRSSRSTSDSPAASGGRSPTASGSSRAGLERARRFTWEETARRTAAVYREVLG